MSAHATSKSSKPAHPNWVCIPIYSCCLKLLELGRTLYKSPPSSISFRGIYICTTTYPSQASVYMPKKKEKRKKRSSRKQKAKQNQPSLVNLKRKKKRKDEKGYPHRTKHNSNTTTTPTQPISNPNLNIIRQKTLKGNNSPPPSPPKTHTPTPPAPHAPSTASISSPPPAPRHSSCP